MSDVQYYLNIGFMIMYMVGFYYMHYLNSKLSNEIYAELVDIRKMQLRIASSLEVLVKERHERMLKDMM